jgi:hypothetical protein
MELESIFSEKEIDLIDELAEDYRQHYFPKDTTGCWIKETYLELWNKLRNKKEHSKETISKLIERTRDFVLAGFNDYGWINQKEYGRFERLYEKVKAEE